MRRLLQAAGFSEPTFDEVHAPVCYGQSVDDALEFVLQFSNVTAALRAMDENEREQALGRLRRMLERHQTDDGVLLDSRAWIVAARRSRVS